MENVKNKKHDYFYMDENFVFNKQIYQLTNTEYKIIESLAFFRRKKTSSSFHELTPNILINTGTKRSKYKLIKNFLRENGWISHKLLAEEVNINPNAIPQKVRTLIDSNIVEEDDILYYDNKNKSERKLRVIRLKPLHKTLVFLEVLFRVRFEEERKDVSFKTAKDIEIYENITGKEVTSTDLFKITPIEEKAFWIIKQLLVLHGEIKLRETKLDKLRDLIKDDKKLSDSITYLNQRIKENPEKLNDLAYRFTTEEIMFALEKVKKKRKKK